MADGNGERTYLVGQASIAARPLEAALHIVATPIGNLGDITLRALETLAAADILAAEDTRVTRVLLDRYGIKRRVIAYHEHNEEEAGPRLVAALKEGRSVALVSDAGTPLVSDPGYRLVGAALEEGIRVVPVPGASAVATSNRELWSLPMAGGSAGAPGVAGRAGSGGPSGPAAGGGAGGASGRVLTPAE